MPNHDDSRAAIIAECVVALTELQELLAECVVALTELQELLATTHKCLAHPLTAVNLLDAAAQHFQVLRANVALLAEEER